MGLETLGILLGSPVLVAVISFLTARLASNKALDTCRKAKAACNDEIHRLSDEITALRAALLTAQARIVGLETEMEARFRGLEGKNAR